MDISLFNTKTRSCPVIMCNLCNFQNRPDKSMKENIQGQYHLKSPKKPQSQTKTKPAKHNKMMTIVVHRPLELKVLGSLGE